MKILITGGAGFIGTHLQEALGGHETSVYDTAAVKPRDILDEGRLGEAVSGQDAVVHLAAVSDVSAAGRDPAGARAANVDGTRNVARACESGGVGMLVFASSAAVYGDAEGVAEDARPDPASEYGRTKAEGERIVHGSAVPEKAVLRIFNAYGPGGRGVVSRFVSAAASGARPVIYGDGRQTRDFVHVRDVAACIRHVLEGGLSGTFNVATGVSTPVIGILRHLAGTGIGEPEYAPAGAPGPRRSGASVARLAAAGFRARTPLGEGIAGMLGPVADQVGHAEQQDGGGQQYDA